MLFAIPASLLAQGPLAPPGAPAPTMKTLQQIEPRTAITSAPYTISSSGSYYLTTNITVSSGSAITIATNGVTLDLNGFTITGTGSANTGILLASAVGNTDITILNGHITGGLFQTFVNGISYSGPTPFNVHVSGVSVSQCGGYGIYLGTQNSTVVDACTVWVVGSYGLEACTVTRSTAYICGLDAITATVASECYGESSTGNGFTVSQTAANCYGQCGGSGVGVSANVANNCYGLSSGGVGVSANIANNCYGYSSASGEGLSANIANNCYGQCNGSGDGLYAGQITTGCFGQSTSGYGLYVSQIAIGCFGQSSSGTGLRANIANSCVGIGTPTNSVIHAYNMP